MLEDLLKAGRTWITGSISILYFRSKILTILAFRYFSYDLVINLGNMQKNRLRTDNIFDCNFRKKEIISNIKKILNRKKKYTIKKSLYYNPASIKKVVQIFKSLNYSRNDIYKQNLKFI